MDVSINLTESKKFNLRVGALIIKEGKILMATNESVDYHYTIGGKVKLWESTEEAVIRECFEETGYTLEIDHLGYVFEDFFYEELAKKDFHEIAFYYFMKVPKEFNPHCTSVADGELAERIEWLEIEKLSDIPHFPNKLKEWVKNSNREIKHCIERE